MPDISPTAILAIFYLAFISQTMLISLYYPRKIAARIRYVLEHFPPADYPKLYPASGADVVATARFRTRLYLGINQAIALVGIGIVVALTQTGYRPAEKGGDEIFVFGYFLLQILPYIWLSLAEMRQLKAMRAAFKARRRTAELRPRRLSDFVAPGYVALAAVCYAGWLVFYLSGQGPIGTWRLGVFAVVLLITSMNIMYILICRRHISGGKLNPVAGKADRFAQAETTVQTLVISSIMVSLFLIVMDAADRFALEIFDPVMASAYMQLTVIFGVGLTLRKIRPDRIDFDVYRAER